MTQTVFGVIQFSYFIHSMYLMTERSESWGSTKITKRNCAYQKPLVSLSGGPSGWRAWGVADLGSGGPGEWRAWGVADLGSGGPGGLSACVLITYTPSHN